MNSNKKDLSAVALNIKKLRNEKGISQDKLSKLAEVSFHTITKIESGDTPNPTIDTVQKIAQALDVGVDDLLNN